ncbi:L,D-transpeptidase family protein [Terrisporobacter sp.]
MKKKLKTLFTALLAILMIFSSNVTISNAASKQLIIINSKYNTLNYYENNILVKKFRCATGKSSTPTPQKKTTIVNKIKNRPYYTLGIPGGDPRNPLGVRWMGLNIAGRGTTYGIHGTSDESSIGKNISGGCIRMRKNDLLWLYNKVRVGTTVIIKNTKNDDTYIAKKYGIKLRKVWYTSNEYKYYCKSNGKYATGWYTIDGKKYYFDSKGRMQTGLKTISNKKYYFGKDGLIKTGWQTISGSKYYFKKTGSTKGQALKGKIKISENYYYFDKNYKMVKNKLVKDYYYGKDGKLVKNKEVKYSNAYYYVGKDGKIYKSCVKEINGYTYTFDDSGRIVDKVKVEDKVEDKENIKPENGESQVQDKEENVKPQNNEQQVQDESKQSNNEQQVQSEPKQQDNKSQDDEQQGVKQEI